MMGTSHSNRRRRVSDLGEHRVVVVRRESGGGFKATLKPSWQYAKGYERGHVAGVFLDGELLDMEPGTTRQFLDIDVTLEGRYVHLER